MINRNTRGLRQRSPGKICNLAVDEMSDDVPLALPVAQHWRSQWYTSNPG
jgi:hypothetical protein